MLEVEVVTSLCRNSSVQVHLLFGCGLLFLAEVGDGVLVASSLQMNWHDAPHEQRAGCRRTLVSYLAVPCAMRVPNSMFYLRIRTNYGT